MSEKLPVENSNSVADGDWVVPADDRRRFFVIDLNQLPMTEEKRRELLRRWLGNDGGRLPEVTVGKPWRYEGDIFERLANGEKFGDDEKGDC